MKKGKSSLFVSTARGWLVYICKFRLTFLFLCLNVNLAAESSAGIQDWRVKIQTHSPDWRVFFSSHWPFLYLWLSLSISITLSSLSITLSISFGQFSDLASENTVLLPSLASVLENLSTPLKMCVSKSDPTCYQCYKWLGIGATMTMRTKVPSWFIPCRYNHEEQQTCFPV
jgi:hypothetical protein